MMTFVDTYEKNTEIINRYKAADVAGDKAEMEKQRQLHKYLEACIEKEGAMFRRVYRDYEISRDAGNSLLDISDVVTDKDVPGLLACIRKGGLVTFTFSSSWSSAVETGWLFLQNGWKLQGMVEVNSQFTDWDGNHEKRHAYKFTCK